MISCEDPELRITSYFSLSAATWLKPESFSFIHVIDGSGMPLTLHVKLAELPTLAVSTDDLYGITILALGGSKAKDDKTFKTNALF